ncbi:RES family NAD+ phosphorylase [Acinetobacter equi]|uniref:RES domain-containing protein n=1 Tax=Acinetobacter equi TaxID=1324350 RepID=A0A0N9V9I8_9GAMM|nr:RES family NAD+ phosphorylase [Acinetobacter equi]ALH95948.1 hypothetical protein AOY20_10630 [Acinetobacter equi]
MTVQDSNIWQSCNAEKLIEPIKGTLYRMIESQEQIATRNLVDSLEEQSLLEEMLEEIKPTYPLGIENLHYLLKTPFRYPPLKWGSRFGRTHEPSIFYGGCSPEATLAESAYYRFVFWYSMQSTAPKSLIKTNHTMFSVKYQTKYGIRLQSKAFHQYKSVLQHPKNYHATQQLGTAMREAGVELFEYASARDHQNLLCVGLFNAKPFCSKAPEYKQEWFCNLEETQVTFKNLDTAQIYCFELSQFLIQDELPLPA